MPEPDATPPPADGALPTILGGMDPGELLARGMQSVKMSSVGAPGWEPPSVAEAAGLFLTYEVLAMLGRGGMGAVFKARQLALDRLVAIKLLPLEISVDRFRRGAHASRVLAKSSRLRALPHAPNAGSARHHSTRLGKFVVSGRHDQHAGRVRSPGTRRLAPLARRTARSAVPTRLRRPTITAPPDAAARTHPPGGRASSIAGLSGRPSSPYHSAARPPT